MNVCGVNEDRQKITVIIKERKKGQFNDKTRLINFHPSLAAPIRIGRGFNSYK